MALIPTIPSRLHLRLLLLGNIYYTSEHTEELRWLVMNAVEHQTGFLFACSLKLLQVILAMFEQRQMTKRRVQVLHPPDTGPLINEVFK